MKQIIQSFKTGDTVLEEVPVPVVKSGSVLIRTSRTLVSLGTEKMLVDFGKANYLQKAKQQPDKVKMVLEKIKSDGFLPTYESIKNKLDTPLPLGYCNAGVIAEVGKGVTKFTVGDRVVSNGNHAEYVCVPENLVAKIPDNVNDDEAAFTVVASIGLQGIRLCNPTFGETIVVYGLGLIGLITSRLLLANGCRVIGIDFDENKLNIASQSGVIAINAKNSDVIETVLNKTNAIGADGVIITASARTNEIISNSAKMSRKKGRIVLVGVIGLDISRADFYEKELTFQVSCSYGAGRYDDNYEQKGHDYPLPYVRWTEQRNFEAILGALSNKTLLVSDLITENVDIKNFKEIYENIGKSKSIASIINYSNQEISAEGLRRTVEIFSPIKGDVSKKIGIIGAGNFTKAVVLPSLKKSGAIIGSISSANGLNGTVLAKKFNIQNSTSDYNTILKSDDIGLVVITTRHNLHAKIVEECLKHGKHVFVEKPLALNRDELKRIIELHSAHPELGLNVGFNRRFSPHIQLIKRHVDTNVPINITATMNAGMIPKDFWVHDPEIGGGRIVGEACHLIDLLVFITGSRIKSVIMNALGPNPDNMTDNASIVIEFENGSNGVVNYFSNGSKAYSKERLEVFWQNKTIIMDNFRLTKGYGIKGFRNLKTKMDKGHNSQFSLLTNAMLHGNNLQLIPLGEILNTTFASFAAIDSLTTGRKVIL